MFNFFVAVVSIGSALYTLSIGFPGTAVFLFVLAGVCVLWGSWDYLVYRRSLSAHSTADRLTSEATQGPAPNTAGQATPQPGVTDPTTKRLDGSIDQTEVR